MNINNNIQETYCSFEVSKLLKEKGFGVICNCMWTGEYDYTIFNKTDSNYVTKFHNGLKYECASLFNWNEIISQTSTEYFNAPTYTLAIEWLRVNFGIWIYVEIASCNTFRPKAYELEGNKFGVWEGYKYPTPQEATEAALLYCLTNLIKQQ